VATSTARIKQARIGIFGSGRAKDTM
jgi:hypothetical protein